MMQQSTSKSPLDQVLAQLERADRVGIGAALERLHPADIADLLESLTPEQRASVWGDIASDRMGDVMVELSEGVRRDLITNLNGERIFESIRLLDIDEIADLIPDLPEELLADVLFSVDREARKGLGEVLSYPEDTAGGLMNLDAVAVRDNISLHVVSRFLRLRGELPEHTDKLFVVDRDGCLTGVLPITSLLIAPLTDPTSQHVSSDPICFEVMDKDSEVAKSFEKYNLVSAPVVDADMHLIGRITVDDVVDVIREDAAHVEMARAGLRLDDDPFAPVTTSARNRTVWLGVNLVTALLGAWVISKFEGSIQRLVALAVLMPIVASMGGNAGSQTLTLVIRGLSTGTLNASNIRVLLKKEVLVGGFNGLIWSVAIALIAGFWYSDPQLGLIIAMATIVNLVIAALAGVAIPVTLEKLGIDPALAGGVALTTVTDVVGYFAVLGLATVFLL
jgi:magnesium transporter